MWIPSPGSGFPNLPGEKEEVGYNKTQKSKKTIKQQKSQKKYKTTKPQKN